MNYSKMADSRRKYVLVGILIVLAIIALIVIFSSKGRYPGIYVNWGSAEDSNEVYPRVLNAIEANIWKQNVIHPKESSIVHSFKSGELKTIGIGTYLKREPLEEIKRSNEHLWKTYRVLYNCVASKLSKHLSTPVTYMKERFTLPGFHIFSGDGWLSSGWHVASVHVDLQYEKIRWDGLDVDRSRTISFTLPLQLPEGAGLYFIDLYKGDSSSVSSLRGAEKKYVKYEVGVLYIHDGHQYHMISPYKKGKERITLQGHAIYSRTLEKYILYW